MGTSQSQVEILLRARNEAQSAFADFSRSITDITTGMLSSVEASKSVSESHAHLTVSAHESAIANKALSDAVGENAAAHENLKDILGPFIGRYLEARTIFDLYKASYEDLTAFIKGSVEAYGEAERAQVRLTAALQIQGTLSPALTAQYKSYSEELEKTTSVSHSAATQAEATLSIIGGVGPDMMQRALKATADYSAATGKSFDAAAMAVAKASEGNVTALSRYGIAITKAQVQTDGMGVVFDTIESKMHGMAETLTHTQVGAWEQLDNQWTSAKEKIGEELAPAVMLLAEGLGGLVGIVHESPGAFLTLVGATTALAGSMTWMGLVSLYGDQFSRLSTLLSGHFAETLSIVTGKAGTSELALLGLSNAEKEITTSTIAASGSVLGLSEATGAATIAEESATVATAELSTAAKVLNLSLGALAILPLAYEFLKWADEATGVTKAFWEWIYASDVAKLKAQEHGAAQDNLAKATSIAKREITDQKEAVEIITASLRKHTEQTDQATKGSDLWKQAVHDGTTAAEAQNIINGALANSTSQVAREMARLTPGETAQLMGLLHDKTAQASNAFAQAAEEMGLSGNTVAFLKEQVKDLTAAEKQHAKQATEDQQTLAKLWDESAIAWSKAGEHGLAATIAALDAKQQKEEDAVSKSIKLAGDRDEAVLAIQTKYDGLRAQAVQKSEDEIAKLRVSIQHTATKESLKEYDTWVKGVEKAAGLVTAALIKVSGENEAARRSEEDADLAGVEAAVRAAERKRDAAIAALDRELSASGAVKDERLRQINELADRQIALAQGTSDNIVAITHSLGMQTQEELDAEAEKWRQVYETLTEDGTAAWDVVYAAEQRYEKAAAAASGGGNALANSLKADLNQIPQLLQQALTGGGGMMGGIQGIGSMIGTTLGKMGGESVGKAIGGMLGLGGPIGAAIGSMVGPLIGMLGSLFDHTGSDVMRDVGSHWGVSLSDGVKKSMVADVKSGMSEVAAELKNMAGVIGDAGGLNPKNLDTFEARLHDVFSMIETHQLTIGQGTKVLDDNWAGFAAAGSSSLGVLDAKLLDIIKLNATFGTQSKQITAYLAGQGTSAATDFGAALKIPADALATYDALNQKQLAGFASGAKLTDVMVNGINVQTSLTAAEFKQMQDAGVLWDTTRVKTKDGAAAMGAAIAGTFDSLIGSGKSFTDAMAAIDPAVTALGAQFAATGFTGGAAFDAIKAEVGLAHDAIAGPALTAVNSLSSGMVALGNMGKLDQGTFEGLGSQIAGTFQSLIKQGKDGSSVMVAMQGPLQTLWEEEHTFGLKLDDSTQALVDEAAAAGVVGEKHKTSTDKMIDALGTLHTDLLGIVTALTGAGGVSAAFTALGKNAKAQLDQIPKTVDISLNEHVSRYSDPTTGNPASFAAQGGMVGPHSVQYLAGGGFPFVPRGTDTVPAMLTPGEMVLTRRDQALLTQLLGGGGTSAPPNAAPAGPQTIVVELHLDGKVIDSRTINVVQAGLVNGNLQVTQRSVTSRVRGY